MAMVVVLGTAGIVYSRDQRQPDNSRPLAAAAGRAGDHWHAALGFDVCGTFLASIPDSGKDPLGLHTHGDGIVHIHPFTALGSGKRAKLQAYFDTVDAKVSTSEFKVPPDNVTHKNGQKCDNGSGVVQTRIWDSRDPSDQGRLYTGNPSDIRPKDGQLITVALLPAGADIPRPPSADQLDKLTDVGPQPTDSTTTTLPGDPLAATSTTIAGSSTTTAPPTTVVPSTTSTSVP